MPNIDVSELSAYVGEHEDMLYQQMLTEMDVMKDVALKEGVEGSLAMTKLSIADGLVPYAEAFNPTSNAAKYSDRVLTVRTGKYDFTLNEEDYLHTWLGAKRQGNAHNIPFYQFTIQEFMRKLGSQVNKDVAYLGDYNASGTTAPTITDGFGTIIADEITATNLTPVATGAITSSNAVAKVQEMYDAAPAYLQNANCYVYVSRPLFSKWIQDRKNNYGDHTDYKGVNDLVIDTTGYTWTMKPVTWMGASSRVIVAVPKVICMGMNTLTPGPKVYIDPKLDYVEARIKFTFGFQFQDLDGILVNDQA